MWLSFAIFWALNIVIILWGMEAIKKFENWAAPFLIVVFLGLMVWMVAQAGGLGPVVEEPGTLGWGPDFWTIFPISLMGMIAFWSTLSLNMPDFTRFGRSQREQAIGQALGLPTTMTLFPLVGVLTTSATVIVFGEAIWDPVALTGRLDNPIVLIIMLAALALATLTTNVAANVVSPSYDFSNAWPKRISFRTGGIITGHHRHPDHALEPARRPQHLHLHVAGHLRRRHRRHRRRPDRRLLVGPPQEPQARGPVPRRTASTGTPRAGTGSRSCRSWSASSSPSAARTPQPGTGPFPADGIIPFLKPFYDYSWVVGLVVAFVIYGVLTLTVGKKHVAAQTER